MARKHVTHRRVQLPVTTYFPPPGQLKLWLPSANDPVLADRSTKATVSAWRWAQAASSANSSQNVTGSVSRRSQIRSDRRVGTANVSLTEMSRDIHICRLWRVAGKVPHHEQAYLAYQGGGVQARAAAQQALPPDSP